MANASNAVRADVWGIGLRRQMGEASPGLATDLGYSAMQFNTVVSTYVNALHLWRRLGFRIVGRRLPPARWQPVAYYLMYRALA